MKQMIGGRSATVRGLTVEVPQKTYCRFAVYGLTHAEHVINCIATFQVNSHMVQKQRDLRNILVLINLISPPGVRDIYIFIYALRE